jgi:hypothetical protein
MGNPVFSRSALTAAAVISAMSCILLSLWGSLRGQRRLILGNNGVDARAARLPPGLLIPPQSAWGRDRPRQWITAVDSFVVGSACPVIAVAIAV